MLEAGQRRSAAARHSPIHPTYFRPGQMVQHWSRGQVVHTVFGRPGQSPAAVCQHGGRIHPCATCGEDKYSCIHSMALAVCGRCQFADEPTSSDQAHDPIVVMPSPTTAPPAPPAPPAPTTIEPPQVTASAARAREFSSCSPSVPQSSCREDGSNSQFEAIVIDDDQDHDESMRDWTSDEECPSDDSHQYDLDDVTPAVEEDGPTAPEAADATVQELPFSHLPLDDYRDTNPDFAPPPWWNEDEERRIVREFYDACADINVLNEDRPPRHDELSLKFQPFDINGRVVRFPYIVKAKIRVRRNGMASVTYRNVCVHGKTRHRCVECAGYLPCCRHQTPYSTCPTPTECHVVCSMHGLMKCSCPKCNKMCPVTSRRRHKCTHCTDGEKELSDALRAIPPYPLDIKYAVPGQQYRMRDPVDGLYNIVVTLDGLGGWARVVPDNPVPSASTTAPSQDTTVKDGVEEEEDIDEGDVREPAAGGRENVIASSVDDPIERAVNAVMARAAAASERSMQDNEAKARAILKSISSTNAAERITQRRAVASAQATLNAMFEH